jgi:L-iditol 2-dehydrogenase
MAMAGQFVIEEDTGTTPATMQAAVYRGVNDVRLEAVPVPQIGASELLLRVHSCGICGTDLKKIATGSHSVPRIFGHETSGVVAAVGEGVHEFHPGDRVVVFHHVPCRDCFYCRRKIFAQCETYKKVGCTAGFEPSGGGFAEYVRVMDWIVRQGTVRIPEGVSFEQACFLEPVNTCMKGIERLGLRPSETVVVIGQGPVGIMLSVLAKRAMTAGVGGDFYSHIGAGSDSRSSGRARTHIEPRGAEANGSMVVTSDLYPQRLTISTSYGLGNSIDASRTDVVKAVRELTEGRGADAAILAVGGNGLIRTAMDAVRPGGRVLLFAQTVHGDATFDPGAVCVDEKTLLGSYSASVELQEDSVRFVMNREMDLERLISHRFPLSRSVEALNLAAHPQPDSMKIVIQPGGSGEGNRA